jgi:hypothetical protein
MQAKSLVLRAPWAEAKNGFGENESITRWKTPFWFRSVVERRY